jgi:hypothetical protein
MARESNGFQQRAPTPQRQPQLSSATALATPATRAITGRRNASMQHLQPALHPLHLSSLSGQLDHARRHRGRPPPHARSPSRARPRHVLALQRASCANPGATGEPHALACQAHSRARTAPPLSLPLRVPGAHDRDAALTALRCRCRSRCRARFRCRSRCRARFRCRSRFRCRTRFRCRSRFRCRTRTRFRTRFRCRTRFRFRCRCRTRFRFGAVARPRCSAQPARASSSLAL